MPLLPTPPSSTTGIPSEDSIEYSIETNSLQEPDSTKLMMPGVQAKAVDHLAREQNQSHEEESPPYAAQDSSTTQVGDQYRPGASLRPMYAPAHPGSSRQWWWNRETDNYKNSGWRGDIQNPQNQIWNSILGGSQDYRTWTGRYQDKYQRNVNGVLCFCVDSKILWVQKNTISTAETANHSTQSNIFSGIYTATKKKRSS